MKKFTLIAIALLTSSAMAKTNMVTTLKIKAWGNNQPAWNITGNRSCIKSVEYKMKKENKWNNINTRDIEPPRYIFDVTHTPGCHATITFHWDATPHDNDPRPDSFARVEMSQYR